MIVLMNVEAKMGLTCRKKWWSEGRFKFAEKSKDQGPFGLAWANETRLVMRFSGLAEVSWWPTMGVDGGGCHMRSLKLRWSTVFVKEKWRVFV